MNKKNGYYTGSHSCYLLQYHLVLVTKYRHPVMISKLRTRMLELLSEYFARWEFSIVEFEVCPDHVHILFDAKPTVALSDFIGGLKSYTSRKMRQEFPAALRKYYWKPYFWSDSYFIVTVSDRSAEVIKHYVKSQNLIG